ncbi:helix-turn-helix transcriptional regulator [Adlercreutzia caecimuris]|jgi:DNA-binding CsgD family transcriptional regulator|uniref:helix-turn-helix transcriptional regulator n=1 Tax=Adlercreutzia caecimuris TaxID=671266 RepID=UPI00256FCE01|nr:helix-turn-helix transcriptional regulator [Adlercreutzia caecimuris]
MLAQFRLNNLTESTAIRSMGLGLAWSWAWTLWGALSSLSGGNSFGVGSSPAWLPALVSCIIALPIFGLILKRRSGGLSRPWIAGAAVAASGGSIALGLAVFLGAPAFLQVLAGIVVGAATALLYLLWTAAYARAARLRPDVVMPLCAAVTVIPIVVISGSIPLASWAFAAALPIFSALMLLAFVRRDVRPENDAKPTAAPTSHSRNIAHLASSAAALIAFYALIGVPSGAATLVGSGTAALFEGAFATLGAIVALLLALYASNRPPTASSPDYLRWALTLAVVGALLYLQQPESLRLLGIALFRIAEVLAFIFLFTFVVIQGHRTASLGLPHAVVLLAASQLGSLVGNLSGEIWGSASANAGESALVSLFAGLCLIASLFARPLPGARTTPLPEASPASDDTEAVCDAIAQTYALAPRQRDVLVHLAAGRTVARTAQALTMSENTVASYVKQIYARLGVHSKQELIDFVQCYRHNEEGR